MLFVLWDFIVVKIGTACFIVPAPSAGLGQALRNVREGRGTHFCGCAGEVKSLGHPPVLRTDKIQ
jgi:hypothetical protein